MRRHQVEAAVLLLISFGSAAFSGLLFADERSTERVSPFFGSFSYSVPISVPSFHGIEPRLALGYSSEARNGLAGVGWTLGGFSRIERVNPGRGTPRFDSTDTYVLDGQELVPCVAGSVSPSCTTGGSHSTKIAERTD
jgi:virulence plasmid B protein